MGVDGVLRWLLFAIGMDQWTSACFWHLWCHPGDPRDVCMPKGWEVAHVFDRLASCMLACLVAITVAILFGRILSVVFFFRNTLKRLRVVMYNEKLLAAMCTPLIAQDLLRQRSFVEDNDIPPTWSVRWRMFLNRMFMGELDDEDMGGDIARSLASGNAISSKGARYKPLVSLRHVCMHQML